IGASGFFRFGLCDRWGAVGRVDWFDPDTKVADSGYRETMVIAALDFIPHPSVHVMPNLLMRRYSRKASAESERDADVTVRVTLQYAYR
ncbi:MAG: hypothetical protein ABIU54_14365, partial [Candidatus Eisenbacteria bacterium]